MNTTTWCAIITKIDISCQSYLLAFFYAIPMSFYVHHQEMVCMFSLFVQLTGFEPVTFPHSMGRSASWTIAAFL